MGDQPATDLPNTEGANGVPPPAPGSPPIFFTMKKTDITLYAAETELTASHVPVFVHGLPVPIYVRAEIGHLDDAKPLADETVLNSVEIGEDDPDALTPEEDDAAQHYNDARPA